MLEAYGMDEKANLPASLGFAGGIGRSQDVCGALTGGIIAIGLDSGRKLEKFDDAWARSSRLSRKLYRDFQAAFGSPTCIELVGPILKDKEIMEVWRETGLLKSHCYKYCEWVVSTLVEWDEAGEGEQESTGKAKG